MMAPVHILCTVRKPELMPAALLVFKTLRVGFPTSPVVVWGNGLTPADADTIGDAASSVKGEFRTLKATSHDAWIEALVMNEQAPFWICDTDMVFFKPVEQFFPQGETIFAGRFEPSWKEPWSNTVKPERLHTCLQWFNPSALRGAMQRWCRQRVPSLLATAQLPFIRQCVIPGRNGNTLYDTTTGLWRAGFGTPFTAEQNAAFEHLHAGTSVDEISKCPTFKDLPLEHQAIYANPSLAAGLAARQNKFYEAHRE